MITLGVLGAGVMGERLLRVAREGAQDIVRITGVFDPASSALRRLPHEVVRVSTADEVIDGAECVYIASPPVTHLAYAEAVLSGGKGVFCEKPLAVDVGAARAFVDRRRAARVAVNFPMASSPAVETLRGWQAAGVVGQPLRVDIEVAFASWPRSWQSGAAAWLDHPAQGGFTREVLSHFLFLTRRLCGPLTLDSANAAYPFALRSERSVGARGHAAGVPVNISGAVGTTLEDDANTWTLVGDRGAIRLRDWAIAERRVGREWIPEPAAMPIELLRPLILRRQLEGVVRMIQSEPHGLATLDEALEVMLIVEAILGRAEG